MREEGRRGGTMSQAWMYLDHRIYYVACRLAYGCMMRLVMVLVMAHSIMPAVYLCMIYVVVFELFSDQKHASSQV